MQYTRRIHPRSRSLKLTLSPSGEVIVTTPRFIPEFAVKQFVIQHKEWIETHRTQIEMKKKSLLNSEADTFLYFGQAYKTKIKLDHRKKVGVEVDEKNKTLIINPVAPNKKSAERALTRFLESALHEFVITAVENLTKNMNVEVQKITFRRQSTRWGSCSSLGNLNFNWQLVHAPEPVIRYVIVHELAHRVHMDHSTQFWKLVERFDPEFRKHRGWLKRHGMILQGYDVGNLL